MPKTVTVTGDNVTADLLLWRQYGVPGQDLTGIFYALNPGLSARGDYLPPGEVVMIPDLPESDPYPEVPMVTLFTPRS